MRGKNTVIEDELGKKSDAKADFVFREVKVEEKKYFSHPKYDIPEDTLIFKSEYDVAKYLLPKVAEKVALYRHLKDS